MLADDLGFADVGFNGYKDIPTPHIDSLAQHGVRCVNGYVSHPFCSPTRAGLLTGRYQLNSRSYRGANLLVSDMAVFSFLSPLSAISKKAQNAVFQKLFQAWSSSHSSHRRCRANSACSCLRSHP
ncbi:MAG: sulfatase-like hydrolase/transferase [Chthoniobacteraceae bacterium]